VWDTKSWLCSVIIAVNDHYNTMRPVTLLPCDKLVTGSMNNDMQVWDTVSGKCLFELDLMVNRHTIANFYSSQCGKLVSMTKNMVCIWT
jgi:hypothetical protein